MPISYILYAYMPISYTYPKCIYLLFLNNILFSTVHLIHIHVIHQLTLGLFVREAAAAAAEEADTIF